MSEPARDPRLVEIDFLMDLERAEKLTIIGYGGKDANRYGGAAARNSVESPVQLYGTDPRRFLEMVHGLIAGRLITGIDLDEEFDKLYLTHIYSLYENQAVLVRLTHAGRVHLWNMRDELLRNPDLEPFGLRSRAAWDRDLFVKLRWATPEAPLSVIFLDLDNFGMVNKKHGHPIGDAVLRLVFQLVNSVVGTRGAVYRYGGEEVTVLLPSLALEQSNDIAEEIRSLIEREVHKQVDALKAPQTVSIGVTSFVHPIENDVAVAKADGLQHMAKLAGKNRVESAA
jgi:diguanylate cyclase (GGDEF)-like protein